MRKLLLLIAGLWLITSCGSKDELPKDVMPREKMQAVMYDLMRSTEFLNTYVFSRNPSIDKQAEGQKWHDKVFEMHKISRAEFEKSFAYYKAHPVLMRTLMDSLNQKEVTAANVEAPIPTQENKPDSANNPATVLPDSLAKARSVISAADSIAATKKLRMLMDSARKKRMVKSHR